ncbi:MAG TPA: hypothetical protein VIF37_11400 [Methylobacter sp.]|jgi:hypothetical protein
MSAKTPETFNYILPRIIRIRDAPFYLGMDKNRFNSEVRPSLTEMKIGTQGIAFDRLELDAWVDELKNRIGKIGTHKLENATCLKKSLALSKGTMSGTSTKLSKADAFAKALAQATKKKPKVTSRT